MNQLEPEHYSDPIAQPTLRRICIQTIVVSIAAMAIAAWRLRSGLAIIGDSGSYLAGAAGLVERQRFDTPLVPSFSEIPVLDTIRAGGWSPYADFGVGLPALIALVSVFAPLEVAAGLISVIAIGFIAAGIVFGPWSPSRNHELWLRSALALAVSCWPILRFTSVGVLSEPTFCAALVWLSILLVRCDLTRASRLVGIGMLTIFLGTTRFVGPIVAIVAGLVLTQWGVSRARVAMWSILTFVGPLLITFVTTRAAGTRDVSLHRLDSTDVFFTARGVGGWFEAGYGDQTSTLLRIDYQPTALDWLILIVASIGTAAVLIEWIRALRSGTRKPYQPALVLAVTLALAVVPSMVFLDAVVKLENRTLMPSGLLVIAVGGWELFRRGPRMIAWGAVAVWSIVATHPWEWLERPDPPRPTPLTEAVDALDVDYVITNHADLVWWITKVPARYVPDGYHDLSDRIFDVRAIVEDFPCPLARTRGAIVVERVALDRTVAEQLDLDATAGRYTLTEDDGVVTYRPTGLGC